MQYLVIEIVMGDSRSALVHYDPLAYQPLYPPMGCWSSFDPAHRHCHQ